MKNFVASGLLAITLASMAVSSASPAAAEGWRDRGEHGGGYGYGGGDGDGDGGGIGAALLGGVAGLALGAALSNHGGNGGYGYGPTYGDYARPVYAQPRYYYTPSYGYAPQPYYGQQQYYGNGYAQPYGGGDDDDY